MLSWMLSQYEVTIVAMYASLHELCCQWDDETDMKVVEKSVRSIVKDGLVWGACKAICYPLAVGSRNWYIVEFL